MKESTSSFNSLCVCKVGSCRHGQNIRRKGEQQDSGFVKVEMALDEGKMKNIKLVRGWLVVY